ncbi:MAG: hypothetical protein WC346_15790 [Methanogenium sp.]|jgi:hypothetical protein
MSKKRTVLYFDIAGKSPGVVLTKSKIVLTTLLKKKIDFRSNEESDKVIYNLTAEEAYQCPDGRIAIPLLKTDEHIFLISLGVTFVKLERRLFLFSGISLKVYKYSPENFNCFLRAEWDALKEDSVHAQPHWHVDYMDVVSTKKETSGLALETEPQEFVGMGHLEEVGDLISELSKFHYAMASSWHVEGDHLVKLEDEDSLANWLKGCLGYIRSQLKFICCKD